MPRFSGGHVIVERRLTSSLTSSNGHSAQSNTYPRQDDAPAAACSAMSVGFCYPEPATTSITKSARPVGKSGSSTFDTRGAGP
jgi:hypothetical protein